MKNYNKFLFTTILIVLITILVITYTQEIEYYDEFLKLFKSIRNCTIQDIKIIPELGNNYTVMLRIGCSISKISQHVENLTLFKFSSSNNASIIYTSISKNNLQIVNWKDKQILFVILTKYGVNISTRYEPYLNRIEIEIGSAIPYGLIVVSKEYIDLHCSNSRLDYDYYNDYLNIKLLGITKKTTKEIVCGFSYVKEHNFLVTILLALIISITMFALLLLTRSMLMLKST